jgi:hypothetical protein
MTISQPRAASKPPSSRGQIGESLLTNHKTDSAARDCAIVFSIAVQFGADVENIRRALCRDDRGRAIGPLGADLAEEDGL